MGSCIQRVLAALWKSHGASGHLAGDGKDEVGVSTHRGTVRNMES